MTEVKRRLAAILSADVVDYTRLMAADEEFTVQTLGASVAIVATEAREHGGRIVNAVGDSVLAEFPSASGAVACALAVLRSCRGHRPDRRSQ